MNDFIMNEYMQTCHIGSIKCHMLNLMTWTINKTWQGFMNLSLLSFYVRFNYS